MGVISIFAIIAAMIAFTPVVNILGSPEDIKGLWTGAGQQALFARSQGFAAYLAIGPVMIGAIILWMVLSVTRRDYTDF